MPEEPAERFTVTPDPRLADLAPGLRERLALLGERVTPPALGTLLDPLMRAVLAAGFREAAADEGTVWLLDRGRSLLTPAYNSGPNAAALLAHTVPLGQGLISLVIAHEQPLMESRVSQNPGQHKAIDADLGVRTDAMIAVPLYFLRRCRGVLSCVKLRPAGAPPADAPAEFPPESLAVMQRLARTIELALDFHFLARVTGYDDP